MFRLCLLSLIVLLPVLAFGQAAAPAISFEVASIKAAPPFNPADILAGKMPHIGMNVSGTRVDIGYMSLADLIRTAYDVKPFQVVGPDWLNADRFDILARMPEGATKEQVPQMLQALLAERFQMKIHRENREHSVYALVTAKGGHKMKEAEPDPEPKPNAEQETKNANNPQNGTIDFGNGTQVRVDRGGAPGGGGAVVTTRENGTMKVSVSPDGQMKMEFSKMTMAQLAETLTPLLDKPVVDLTELKGNYQAAIEMSMADMLNMARAGGIAIPGVGGAGPFAGPGARGGNPALPAQASDPSSNAIFTSVQQLGLRLDSRKAPVEFIIVDRVEKTPTEN